MNRHPNPEIDSAPDRESWPEFWRELLHGPVMADLRDVLTLKGRTPRSSVVLDLCEYYGVSEDECIEYCTNWGPYFDREWDAAQTPEEFHRTTRSSSFSLLWAAYCELAAYDRPRLAGAASVLRELKPPPGAHLDFASGVGVASQLFARLGYTTTLADISTTMLDFARFRIERRGQRAEFLDLNRVDLPVETYDIITATDVLWLVSDPLATFRALHDALRSDGVLYANIDPDPHRLEARWQLCIDELKLRRQLQQVGFEPVRRLPHAGTVYRKVPRQGPLSAYRAARDRILLGPIRPVYRRLRDRRPVGSRARHP